MASAGVLQQPFGAAETRTVAARRRSGCVLAKAQCGSRARSLSARFDVTAAAAARCPADAAARRSAAATARCSADAAPDAESVTLSRRLLAPSMLALAAAASPAPAHAGLKDYDVSGRGILETRMELGAADGALVFSPSELSFEQGRVYKLTLTNPSPVEHYFSARDFASKVYTILVEVAGAEVKGAVTELALDPGASLTWIFVPLRPGRYPLLCPVTGHVEGGMVGSLVVTPAKR